MYRRCLLLDVSPNQWKNIRYARVPIRSKDARKGLQVYQKLSLVDCTIEFPQHCFALLIRHLRNRFEFNILSRVILTVDEINHFLDLNTRGPVARKSGRLLPRCFGRRLMSI